MRIQTLSFATCVALLIAAGIWSASGRAQSSVPDLVGTWSGSGSEGAVFGQLGHQPQTNEPTFSDKTIVWTLTIDQQDGRGLIGSWSSPSFTEPLVGVVRQDNETVHFADNDTIFIGRILSPTSMEVCSMETGASSVAGCRIHNKQ